MTSHPVRIAVTGVGLVTPAGLCQESTWKTILQGVPTADWLPEEFCKQDDERWHAARVPWQVSNGQRLHEFALRAAAEAITTAGLGEETLANAAAVIGTSKSDLQAIDAAWDSSPDLISRLWLSTPARLIAERFNLRAGAICPVAACATGLVSIIRGANLIREGVCDVVVAGSADASIHPGLLASYKRLGVLATVGDGEDPAHACRPFDLHRHGFVVGEGAAVLTLERWEHAVQRGATPLAEWIDGAVAADLSGLTAVDTTGETLAHLIRKVLTNNQVAPAAVQGVSVHGTATPMNDSTESHALQNIFRDHLAHMHGFGIKGAIGHLMGAAGAVESALCVLALRDQLFPPTTNHETADPAAPLPMLTQPQPQDLQHVLKLSLGFGGHLAVGLLRRVEA